MLGMGWEDGDDVESCSRSVVDWNCERKIIAFFQDELQLSMSFVKLGY